MSVMQVVIDMLGFDPTRLAGRPTGYALAYALVFVLSVAFGGGLVLITTLRHAAWIRTWCLLGVVIGLVWVTAVQHLLLVEYPGKTTIAPDTGVEESYIIPVPLPGLRSRQFERWSVGSPAYRNAEPWEYAAEGLKPENVIATYVTIALHWLGLLLMLSCLIAASGLGIKSLLHAINSLFRHR